MKLPAALPCSRNINNKNYSGQRGWLLCADRELGNKKNLHLLISWGIWTLNYPNISWYIWTWYIRYPQIHSSSFSCSFLSLRLLQSPVSLALWLQGGFGKTGARLEGGWKKISRASSLLSLYFICCLWLWLCLPYASTREPLYLWS